MLENETPEEVKPSGKPPYLFLIPVALGIVGFIGYQTVRVGMETSVTRSPYAIDTSVAQAVVQNGVITIHARRAPAPHRAHDVERIAMAKPSKPEASPAATASSGASAPPSASPAPKPTPAPKASPTAAASKVAAASKHHAHRTPAHEANGEQIAVDTVPQIEHPIAMHAAAASVQSNQAATPPPITDAPIVQHHPVQQVAQATAAPTAKPAVVAQAPAAAAPAGPIDAADRIVEARMKYAAAPEYPDIARDQGVRGTSVVFVTVDSHGTIVHMSIASSSGNGSLDRAALSAARSSSYVAPNIDGKPAIETYRVTYDFAP